jgi:hypothetical protein
MNLPPAPSTRVANLWHGLLREILLQDGTAGALVENFFVGYGDNDDPFGSRIGISWWRSKRYARLERALALAIRQDMPTLKGISLDDIVDGISAALKDNALNRSLTNVIFAQSPAKTLHSVYSQNHPEKIAESLWERFVRYVSAELDAWLFVYPLERVIAETGSFSCGDFCILSTVDQPLYLKYCEKFPGLRSLDVATGTLRRDMTLTKTTTLSWLLIEGYGTGESVLDWGKQRASFFIGVLFSAIRVHPNYSALTASSGDANGLTTVISAGNANYSFKGSDRGPILHSVLGTIEISKRTLDITTRWMNECLAAVPNSRIRSETAARWINQAALHRDHVRFLFFFFAIDALFGMRGEVENSIVKGVQSRMSGNWPQRCEWLFDLRSELVHGGSASLSEWRRYEKYCSHFQSEPEHDVEEIAATCLMRFYSMHPD